MRILVYIFLMSPTNAYLCVRNFRSIANISLSEFGPFIQMSFGLNPWYFSEGLMTIRSGVDNDDGFKTG